MIAPRRFLARVVLTTIGSLVVGALGCEQLIGLDGPYIQGPGGECDNGAVEECYSGEEAVKGIGACQPGTRTCTDGAWGACTGEGSPSIEACRGNDDDCNGNATCTGALEWALSFGGTGADSSSAVATDASSNIIVAGAFDKPGFFGGALLTPVGSADVVIIKLGPTGKHLWSKSFGSANGDFSRAVAVDSEGNIIVVGGMGGPIDFGGGPLAHANTSVFVVKFDPDGNHLWSRSFTGAMSVGGTDTAVDRSGNVIVTTTITGSMDFGSGLQTAQNESLAVVKLDSSGKNVFSRLFGASKCCGSLRTAMSVDSLGNIGIGGTFNGQIIFGDTTLNSGQNDVFVVKLSPTGDSIWSLQGAGMGNSAVEGVDFDSTGAIVVSGTFPSPAIVFGSNTIMGYSNMDAFVAKFTTDGEFAWGKGYGMGGAVENGAEVVVDDADNISFTGNTTSNSLDLGTGKIGLAGLFVVKLDPDGNPIWSKTTDTATTPYPSPTLAVDKEGHTILSRGFTAPMSIEGTPITGYGSNDIFVIKLGP